MNSKFIVVEGMDRCGKDTLIKGLRKQIQSSKILDFHCSTPPKGVDPYKWSYDHYDSILKLGDTLTIGHDWDVIANRCHLGETVYGPMYRGTDPSFVWQLESQYCNHERMWLVVLVDDGENIVKRDDGLSNEKSAEDFDRVRDMFIDSFDRSCIPNKILINVGKNGWPDPQQIYERIYG